MSKVRFLGLDVHANTISVAIAEPNGQVRSLGVIRNAFSELRKLIKRLEPVRTLRACYEAGPTGYVLYWQLTQLNVHCEVVAPSLIPMKAGERIKTDRRDAEKLSRCYRAGDLTPVWVPDTAHEALRDLARAREDARQDQTRARHRLGKFLLRHDCRPPQEIKRNWTQKHMTWIKRQVAFEQPALQAAFLDYVHEVERAAERIERLEKALDEAIASAPPQLQQIVRALQALRGIGKLVAASLVAEIGLFSRFSSPTQLMSYCGLVPGEHSSGSRVCRGSITKTGNSHVRRLIVESAWSYQHKPWIGGWLEKRLQGLEPAIQDMSWKAQWRLHTRYKKLSARGKNKPQIVTAIARELLGFLWAIAVRVESQQSEARCAA
jgi:transposase